MGLYELRTVYAPAPGRDVLAWMEDAVCRAGRARRRAREAVDGE